MTSHNELRLLPWAGPDGKPCYLSTDDDDSHMSRLADNTEEIQLGMAAALVAHALEALDDERTDPDELRCLTADLADALNDMLRVATSRGHRLTAPGGSTHEGNDGPQLPAAAVG
ncbi:hypothetical protein ACGFYP_21595 [Streptomyces sp. NPDC048370]|uniref:hypothetical protein n=1 Tax=Streptomyces sp. NPDC048370 TaxID=3365540 RepID=UPI003715F87B